MVTEAQRNIQKLNDKWNIIEGILQHELPQAFGKLQENLRVGLHRLKVMILSKVSPSEIHIKVVV